MSEAFAVARPADDLIRGYLATEQTQKHRDFIERLWSVIAPRMPGSYRGIGRIVRGVPPPPDGRDAAHWFSTMHISLTDPLLPAQLAVDRLSAPDDDSADLLLSVNDARQVLESARGVERLEVIAVRRRHFVRRSSVVGFDVGYWGGDHYSILCDSIVTPTWHPPQPEDFETLASLLSSLNEHLLFPTEEAALTKTPDVATHWRCKRRARLRPY